MIPPIALGQATSSKRLEVCISQPLGPRWLLLRHPAHRASAFSLFSVGSGFRLATFMLARRLSTRLSVGTTLGTGAISGAIGSPATLALTTARIFSRQSSLNWPRLAEAVIVLMRLRAIFCS